MTGDTAITPEALGGMIISDVLERWPATAEAFHTRGMACVGCAVAPFYTIEDAALVYGLSPAEFAADLMRAIWPAAEEQAISDE